MAAILILGVKVPYTAGGQEVLVKTLSAEIRKRGHLVDVVELPFNLPSREALLHQAALWRSVDLTEFAGTKVDLVISTKFPSYYARHPKKSLWLVHQHRPLYDLYGTNYSDFTDDPRDESLRRMLVEADEKMFSECAYISGISKNVVTRLKHYNRVDAEALYPPLPLGNRYCSGIRENFILSVGRICGIKRVDLLVKSLPMIHEFIKLKIVGAPDEPGIMDYLTNEIAKHHLQHRVEFLGRVSDDDLLDLYSRALAVYYAPHNEDYGYVTLEAFASTCPVVTGTDSGGVLEFVTHGENGLIANPTLSGISDAFNVLVADDSLRVRMGLAGRKMIEEGGLLSGGWDRVTERLLSPLSQAQPVRAAS